MKEGDRVKIRRGSHEGRVGTVSATEASTGFYGTVWRIMCGGKPGTVIVALDGEAAQPGPPHGDGRGGRGGESVAIPIDVLEPVETP